MAKNSTNSAEAFYEVVFQGKPKVVRAFVAGLLLGSDREATVFYNFDEGVQYEGKAERLAEKIGLRTAGCHLIVDGETSAYLKAMAKPIAENGGLEISAHRRIRSASMDFRYHAFAQRYDEEIVKLVKNLPEGLKLRGFKHDVKLDPKAEGIEAYTPSHHFEACGEGQIHGSIDLLIGLRRALKEFPLIEAGEIELKLA
ncbi:hypothetical protein KJ682_18425 [bacterium]|nr:hypothetical protein [bacterium]